MWLFYFMESKQTGIMKHSIKMCQLKWNILIKNGITVTFISATYKSKVSFYAEIIFFRNHEYKTGLKSIVMLIIK